MLSIAQIWVERRILPEWLGMWWVHAVLFAVALLLVIRQSGVFTRARIVAPAAS